MIAPHGGILRNGLIQSEQIDELVKACSTLPIIKMSSRETADLLMIATGAFSPLDGFMIKKDYDAVVSNMRLANGILWPLPVTLSVDKATAKDLRKNSEAALIDDLNGKIVGRILVDEIFEYDKNLEAMTSFGTDEKKHPGVNKLFAQKDYYVGGRVEVFHENGYRERYPEYARPAEVRAVIAQKGWSSVVAFQTRNPIHRSHEYLTKVALEMCDGILIHPVVGGLKDGDIPADVRMDCYRTLLRDYYPKDRTLLRVYPMEMRYGGPKEALLHAIIRQNFGCDQIIIGRDHAGVGSYYGAFEAQEIFDTLAPGDLLIRPFKMDFTFWCEQCSEIASNRTCPHPSKNHVMISGSELRKMLEAGKRPPLTFTRPEIADILISYYQKLVTTRSEKQ